MRVLILGSEGQIGQYLAREARADGHSVVKSDLLFGNDHDLRSRFNPLVYDRMTWADFVYFLAFDVGGSRYLAERQGTFQYLDNNVKLMHNTFELLDRIGTPFLFASSQMSNMVDSSYGTLKRIGEFYTRALGGINVRFWNVYGEERDPEKFHAVTDFIRAAHHGEIRLRTDGHERRQFLYGQDGAQALLALADAYEALDLDRYYDVTSFEWTSILNIAELVASLHPGDVTVLPGTERDMTQTVENQPTDAITNYWRPTTSLTEGIRLLMG